MGVSANKGGSRPQQMTAPSAWTPQGDQTAAVAAQPGLSAAPEPKLFQPMGDYQPQGHVGQINTLTPQAAQPQLAMQQAGQQPMPQMQQPQIAPQLPQPQVQPMPQTAQLGGAPKGDLYGGYIDPIRTLGGPGKPVGITPRTRLF